MSVLRLGFILALLAAQAAPPAYTERDFLTRVRRLTVEGRRAGEGSVWVTSFEFPLSRIDPSTNEVVQQFHGKGGDAIRVGLGSVWLSNLEAGNVWRLDPKRIEATLPN